jgi:signal peptidase
MVPEFWSGDMVFVKITPAKDINVQDIITFNPSSNSDAYLTHRVIEKIDNYEGTGVTCFRTKGDANDSEDSFLVDEGRVIGIVKFHVPKLGIVIRFLQLRWYFVLPLVIMLFVFLGLIKYYFELKEEGDEEEDAEDEEHAQEEQTREEQITSVQEQDKQDQ